MLAAELTETDDVVLLRNQTWGDWLRMVASRGEGSVPRLAFLDGDVELIVPSRTHERIKTMIGRLVEAWALHAGVDVLALGSWTLKAEDRQAGAEADECYQVGQIEKPRPDVAIEVVYRHRRLDKLEVYRRLGVGEVWIWDRGALTVHLLENGVWIESGRSRAFPDLDLKLLVSLLDRPTVTQAQRELLLALRGS